MNILVLAHRLPFPANKGEKIRTYNQIKFLAELGHNVEVMAPEESLLDRHANEHLEQQFPNLGSQTFKNSNKLIRLAKGFISQGSLSVANFYSDVMFKAFEARLKQGDVEAVLCTSSAMVKYIKQSKMLNTLSHKPVLLMDFMDLDSDKWRQYSDKSLVPMSWLYRREQRLIEKAELESQQLFDACYLIADAEVSMFKQVHGSGDKVHVLGNGLNMQEFYPATNKPKNPDGPVFIFTGVMDYKPNVDAVLWFVEQCWDSVLGAYPNAKFIVAGMNPNKEILELAAKPGLEVTGFVEEILPYYHQADYFVAPFRLARGVQNKVLQAFACGLPVITTPMGAEGIPCIDGEHVLLGETAEEFMSHIHKLEAEPEFKAKLSNNALALIKDQFSWEGKLKPLKDILDKA